MARIFMLQLVLILGLFTIPIYGANFNGLPINELKDIARKGDVNAQIKLGDLYYNGKEVPRNYQEAKEWYEKAAEQGHPRAQAALASLYRTGKAGEQDYKKAAEWYEKSANQGRASAQFMLGE